MVFGEVMRRQEHTKKAKNVGRISGQERSAGRTANKKT